MPNKKEPTIFYAQIVKRMAGAREFDRMTDHIELSDKPLLNSVFKNGYTEEHYLVSGTSSFLVTFSGQVRAKRNWADNFKFAEWAVEEMTGEAADELPGETEAIFLLPLNNLPKRKRA